MKKDNPFITFLSLAHKLGVILLIYTFLRVCFYWINVELFNGLGTLDFLKILGYGIRFDTSAILYVNSVFIVLYVLPLPISAKVWYRTMLLFIYVISNCFALIFALADLVYFKHTLKRTTGDIFELGDDLWVLLSSYIKDFWYLFLLLFAIANALIWLYKRMNYSYMAVSWDYFKRALLFLSIMILSVIGMRGGLQYVPIGPINALEYVDMQYAPMVTNTPLSILYTLDHKKLVNKNYFTDDELQNIFDPYKDYSKENTPLNRKNVFLIVLESFSYEYLNAKDSLGYSYTPFLDSLSRLSLKFSNCYANGTQSNQGIVSICGGIPALMSSPFMNSIYQNNRFEGLGEILRAKDYQTMFFHGGTNGTMKFDAFTKAAGFSKYYGRNEFNDERFYDGAWGIYDEPFFQFTAKTINEADTPFLGVLFSLSSHHPYHLPDEYKDAFPNIRDKFLRTVKYTDNALKIFFDIASKSNWYSNTLFIITADHVGVKKYNTSKSVLNNYHIPLMIFAPGDTIVGMSDKICQQIDIMPSVLDYVNYDTTFFAFGQSIFKNNLGYAYQYRNGIYQIADKDYFLRYVQDSEVEFGHLSNGMLVRNIEDTILLRNKKGLKKRLQAIIQSYNNRLNSNTYSLINTPNYN